MIVRIGEKRYTLDNCINWFVAGVLLLPIYIDFFGTLSEAFGFSTTITTYIYYGALWALLLLSVPMIASGFTKNVIMGTAIVVLGILLHYLLYPSSREYVFGTEPMSLFTFAPQTLATVVPYTLIGLAVLDIDKLKETLYITAKIGIIIGVVSYLVAVNSGHGVHYDDMNQAYAICVMNCILIADYKKKDWIFLGLGLLTGILAGTRGAIVGALVAFLLRITMLQSRGTKRAVGILGSILSIVLILFTPLPQIILKAVSNLFTAIGVTHLRLLDYAQEGMLLDSSGRDGIQEVLIAKIFENPLFGYGVGADRGFTQTHTYAHNMLIEIWLSFGLVVGTIVLVWMAYYLYRAIAGKNTALQAIATALFSGIVVKLMLSSSFLYSKELFILLGICCAGLSGKAASNAKISEVA